MVRTSIHRAAVVVAAGLLLASTAGPVAAEDPAPEPIILFDSEPGDPIGEGLTRLYTSSEAAITMSVDETATTTILVTVGADTSPYWEIRLRAPGGYQLVPTTYWDVAKLGTETESQAGLHVTAGGRGCSTVTGEIGIEEVAYAADGSLEKLAAFVTQRCDESDGLLYIQLRVGSAHPLAALRIEPTALTFGPQVVGTTSAPQTVKVTSIGTGSVNISVDHGYATEWRISSDTCLDNYFAPGTSCSFAVSFVPELWGTRTADLLVRSHSTYRDDYPVHVTGEGLPPSGTWQEADFIGPQYSWNYGGSLVRTVTSTGTEYLHAAMTRDYINNRWVTNSGPYLGVYYVRYRNGSETTPYRMNPATQHGDGTWLASSGANLYGVWFTLTRVGSAFSPTAPRAVWFRRNSSHGSSTAWGAAKRLSSSSGRVDYPSVAAAGSNVYVSWTDSDTGSIKLAISRDRGATWTMKSVGSTTRTTDAGRLGIPVVTARGTNVAVVWLANNDRAVKARISRDSGTTFASAVSLADSSSSVPHAHAAGNRVGFTWTTASGVFARIWEAGTWQTRRKVTSFSSTATYKAGYGPAIALVGTSRVGIAWAECRRADCRAPVHLSWKDSSTDGRYWNGKVTVSGIGGIGDMPFNEWPSVVWSNSSRRHLLHNGSESDYSIYRLFIRRGDNVAGSSTTSFGGEGARAGRVADDGLADGWAGTAAERVWVEPGLPYGRQGP